MAQIEVASFAQIATVLSQLATNYSNLFADYYNLFYNPNPMDVTVELYDDEGNLTSITIPNRAKDRTYILNGNGNPEQTVSAVKGSIYQDLQNGDVYVKQFDTSNSTGWRELMTISGMSDFLIQSSGNPNGSVTAKKGVLYIDKATAELYIKSTDSGNTGWNKISLNTEGFANTSLDNLVENVPDKGADRFANKDLSNLTSTGENRFAEKEDITNKVTTIANTSTDTEYPSAKATYNFVVDTTPTLAADKNLSNLNQEGEDHFVRPLNQVRDCIFKAPNGLPSASGNIISLPQGTILLCADGVDDNRASVNEKITTISPLNTTVNWTSPKNGMVFFNGTNNSLIYISTEEYFRQIAQPSISTTNGIWYNPNTNDYKITSNSGSTWTKIKAAEIGRFTTNGSGVISSFYPYHPLRVALEDDLNNIVVSQRNVGEIISSFIPLEDAGLHLLDGAKLYSTGSYADFYNYMNKLYTATPTANYFCSEADWQTSETTYGVCGKFVVGSDSDGNYVRLPKVTGFVEGTIDVTALGDLVEAGLPNVSCSNTGSDNLVNRGTADVPFYKTGDPADYNVGSSGSGTSYKTGFDLSLANSIYGNSNTVQPQSIKGFMYIIVATSPKTPVQIDIDEIATDLNGKADIDLSNINNTAKIRMSGMGMPSETYVNLTLGASETEYVAPANGWVQLTQAFTTTAYILIATVYDTKDGLCMMSISSSATVLNAYLPVSKGETFKISYSGTLNTSSSENRFEFIYAVGSESEAS